MTFNAAMLDSMAAMLPPGLTAAMKVLGTSIPPLADKVISGELSPEAATDLAAADIYVVFKEMKENAGKA